MHDKSYTRRVAYSQTVTIAFHFSYVFLGHGVFAQKNFMKGEYLLEYAGAVFKNDSDHLCDYNYFYQHKGKNFW
jgi:hypothetical protein